MTSPENIGNNGRGERSAWKAALIVFAVTFVVSACWNLARKTGDSVVDAFGIAAITAIFSYFLNGRK